MNSEQAPSLVLQMQRMGDLILTFPLLARLRAAEPERPLWVVAEERFFTSLIPFAPNVVFFPPEAAPRLAGRAYRRVVNLSHRGDAARLAAGLKTEERLGMTQNAERSSIAGYWHLYRASLVQNNRHNRFHWAELNMLDLVDPRDISRLHRPRPPASGRGRVGLFVGASEREKRPSPPFWGELARALAHSDLHPVFLGGPEDGPLAAEAAGLAGMPGANLCGRFTLRAFAEFLHELDLLIVPDTGPMHLAAWLGTPVLNLSLGPVHAWDTGPAAPGHHVLRPNLSCSGCWSCTRAAPACRPAFTAERAASVARTLLRDPARLTGLRMPGLELCVTARSEEGLFALHALTPRGDSARRRMGRFWQAWFLDRAPALSSGGAPSGTERSRKEAAALAAAFPRLVPPLRAAATRAVRECAAAARRGGALPAAFWRASPPLFTPFTGRMQLFLQNEEYGKKARALVLEELEELARIFG